MSGIVLAAMPRVTRRYDNAAANQSENESIYNGSSDGLGRPAATSTGGGYTPVAANDGALHCVTFKWARACQAYSLQGQSAIHSGGGLYMNRPVLGDLAMPPGTGRYFYEVRVNSASCKLGVCTQGAYPTDKDLEACELGTLPQHDPRNEQRVATIDGQTSRVYVNGKEVKHLWRLFVATCGALFSFVVDTDEGLVQLFVDKKYVGMVFDASAGLKGKTLYPCASLAGLDMHNRSIGTGNLTVSASPAHKFDCLY